MISNATSISTHSVTVTPSYVNTFTKYFVSLSKNLLDVL